MEKLLKNLPPLEHEFEINVKGDITNLPYTGKFKYRKPNLKTKAMAEKKRAELDGPNVTMLDLGVQKLNYMVAYLMYTLTEAPSWWRDSDNGYALLDFNVVEEVFNECDRFESEWNAKVWPKEEKSDEGEK
jgi:hypothetical protein